MSNKKLLIVEDDADVCLGYRILLRANHYDTVFAADAVGAISEAGKQTLDLILLDLGLPPDDGFLVLQSLQADPQLSTIPVIVVSGRDLHANKERALKAGASAFLQKPWNDDELLALIRQLVSPPVDCVSSVANTAGS